MQPSARVKLSLNFSNLNMLRRGSRCFFKINILEQLLPLKIRFFNGPWIADGFENACYYK